MMGLLFFYMVDELNILVRFVIFNWIFIFDCVGFVYLRFFNLLEVCRVDYFICGNDVGR